MMQKLMARLAGAFGVSGFEDEIRATIARELEGVAGVQKADALGNLVVHLPGAGKDGKRKRVLLAAHMDQIGLMVTHIDAKGFMRFTPVGHIYSLAAWGGQVRFADGTVGTIGLDGGVNRNGSVPELRDMYIDIGATARDDVRQQVGDVAVFWPGFSAQGSAWFSPNLDDRVGCAILVQLLHDLKGQALSHDLFVAFTTQEEIGIRGAGTSAFAIQPDVAIAIDVTLTGDTPRARPAMQVELGKGVAIKVKDAGMISHGGLNRRLIETAQQNGIPYQLEVLEGGTTDARAMQLVREGVPATALSIPSRHVHTPSEIVDKRDVAGALSLLKAYLKDGRLL